MDEGGGGSVRLAEAGKDACLDKWETEIKGSRWRTEGAPMGEMACQGLIVKAGRWMGE